LPECSSPAKPASPRSPGPGQKPPVEVRLAIHGHRRHLVTSRLNDAVARCQPPERARGWFDSPATRLDLIMARSPIPQGCVKASLARRSGCKAAQSCRGPGHPTRVCGPRPFRWSACRRCVTPAPSPRRSSKPAQPGHTAFFKHRYR
jgi:hypothetical protein